MRLSRKPERKKRRRVTDRKTRSRGKSRSSEAGGKGPEVLEDILRRWLKENSLDTTLGRAQLETCWKDTVGDEVADRTRIVDLRGGTLVVEVDSAPLLGELSAYYREEIMSSLRQSEGFPNFQNIRFRAGTFEAKT
ncbi:MAG TPA: hypothetical protein DD471_05505 [Planctomycetes bacterium]|nr:hypothetical protein [Planctomycetota bacterium]